MAGLKSEKVAYPAAATSVEQDHGNRSRYNVLIKTAARCLPAGLLLGLLPMWAPPAWGQPNPFDPRSLAPFVPTPLEVVERMLVLGEVKSGDTLYDLGSGDGRIVITAAQRFGAKAVGVELNADLAKRTQARIEELYIGDRAKVVEGDVMDVDLSGASVVTLYFLSASNMKLRPKLEESLKPGTRVISHDFRIFGWTPVKTESFQHESRTHTIFVYRVGRNGR